MSIAEPAIATAQQGHPLSGGVEVRQHGLLIVGENLGAERNLDDDVRGARTGAVRSRPIAALSCPEVLRVAKVDQCVQIVLGLEYDVPALAAIAAIRAAELDKLLPSERHHTVPAVPGAQIDLRLVE